MKNNLLFLAIFTSFISIAQNIESKIPNNAEAVISINGDRLTELISIAEFDNYNFVKELFDEVNRKDRGFKRTSIKDFGFDVSSKAYYFYKKTDSIGYHTFLVKLTDKTKFESLLPVRDRKKIVTEGNNQILVKNSTITIWNDTLLFFSGYDDTYGYFRDNEARFMAEAENKKESYYEVKKRIVSKWAKAYALGVFRGNGKTSILNDKNYVTNKDKKAAASLWVRNYGQLISGTVANIYMPSFSPYSESASKSGFEGFKSIVANLYFDENVTRMTTEMEVSSELGKIFKKVYNSKMDTNFYNYFNKNDVLAYMSLSMNTESLLEEYPAFLTSLYGGIMPGYKEEIGLSSSFLSLVIDEEAIGELITGDMLFVLNDIKDKEVIYTSYDYDEDYNRTEVTKTKKEVGPEFTIMIGSKRGKLLNKVANLGIKHKLVENKAGYYKIDVPKNEIPFDLYTVVKNNILFFTTSKEKILNIVNNRFVKNLGKHQNLIKNNNSIFYVNGEKMISKIPASEFSKNELKYLNYVKDNFKDAYFKSSKIKGNKIQSEVKINTSSSQDNSLKTLLSFFEVIVN